MFFELKASSTALLNLGKRYLEAKLDFKHMRGVSFFSL